MWRNYSSAPAKFRFSCYNELWYTLRQEQAVDQNEELDRYLDLPGQVIRVGPVDDPELLAERLRDHSNLVINPDILERIATERPFGSSRDIIAVPVSEGTTITYFERFLKKRGVAPWMLGFLLWQELTEVEGPLEGGQSLNLFWFPEPVAVHWDITDDKLHVDWLEAERLGKFDKVFLGASLE